MPPKATPRATLEALRQFHRDAHKIAQFAGDVSAPMTLQFVGLLIDVVEHQVVRWEENDRILAGYERCLERAARGDLGDNPEELLRELLAVSRPH